MSLRTRLRRLEQTRIDVGCPACRDRRGRTVFLTAERLADGTVVAAEEEPQPCAQCGQIPELIIEVVEAVVDERTGASEGEASA
jgi:hypothetical protein